jgi:transposase
LLLKAPNSVILKEEHRIRERNGYEKLFGFFSDLRRWRKLPHEKAPHSALLTYKVNAFKSKRIRLFSLFKALSQHCPAEYEVLGRTLKRHPPTYEA